MFEVESRESVKDVGLQRKTERPISPKMELALRLHVFGAKELKVAAEEAGVSYNGLSRVLRTDQGRKMIEHLRSLVDEEFKNRSLKVLGVLDVALDHADPKIALAGASLWMKYYRPQRIDVSLSAEDVVKKMMEISK